jgi:hypothetical protein
MSYIYSILCLVSQAKSAVSQELVALYFGATNDKNFV